MTLAVTLHVYSGRPNPGWILSDKQGRDFLEISRSLQDQVPLKARATISTLGYRGFSISPVPSTSFGALSFGVNDGLFDTGQSDMSLIDHDRNLESFLLESADDRISAACRELVRSALEVSADEAIQGRAALAFSPPPPSALTCTPMADDAPPFTRSPWNDLNIKPLNNCYNYANNKPSGNFAQPGLAHGAQATVFDRTTVIASASADGLVVVPADLSTHLGSQQGWYVALCLWPGEDYHWYRQDANGCWSHKPGKTSAVNVDNRNRVIRDPRSCARKPYTEFCTFMITNGGVVVA